MNIHTTHEGNPPRLNWNALSEEEILRVCMYPDGLHIASNSVDEKNLLRNCKKLAARKLLKKKRYSCFFTTKKGVVRLALLESKPLVSEHTCNREYAMAKILDARWALERKTYTNKGQS